MAMEAVVSVVLQKLTDMLKVQSLTQNIFIVYEVEEIMKCLHTMRDLVSSTKQINHQAQEYLEAVYNVEDGIEKFTLNVVRRRKVFGFLTNHIFFFNNLNSCQKIHQNVKRITIQLMKLNGQEPCKKSTSIKEVSNEEGKHNETVVGSQTSSEIEAVNSGSCMKELNFSYSCNEEEMQIVGIKERRFLKTRQMESFSYRKEELELFGLKEDIDTLIDHLTDKSEHVISIFGQGGIGKTTLARTIYRNRNIKRHFHFRAWVSVLEGDATEDILQNLLQAIDNSTDKAANIDDKKAMKLNLSSFLMNKRYLIILDGVSSCNIWEDIKETFPDEKNGSKLVLTSSKTMETTQMSVFSHRMTPLTKDDSWRMLRAKVGKEQSWALIPEHSKQVILQSCKGLPLNIVLLAGLFSMKDPSSWSHVFSCKQDSVDVLSLCYHDLTDHLKVCLLYSVLFPKEFDIPVRRLLRLWLAEGFVKQSPTEAFPEDMAQTYFDELVNRNMLQISKLRSDNSPRQCRVLGVLHDYLLPKAHEANLFCTYRNLINCEEVTCLNVRRMVEYESLTREQGNDRLEATETEYDAYPSSSKHLTSFASDGSRIRNQSGVEMSNLSSPKKTQPKSFPFKPSHVRSYTSFSHKKTDYRQAERIGIFLGNIINDGPVLLRVLDLEGVYKPILPENLGDLCNLRYLGLRLTYLDSLPPSVGELIHLETLDLKHTCIDDLPGSIWRLKKLHHLNLNDTSLNMQPHSSLKLLTLWGLFVDKKAPIKDGLDKLHDLRELGITFQLSSNQDDLMDWIINLYALRSLRLRSKDHSGRPSNLMFKSMSNLEQLSNLNLLGSLERLPLQNEFPPTLKVLTLSISRLKMDPMHTLGQLPCLTVLRLLGQSYVGKEMCCHKGGFSKLKLLKMWMLKELRSWVIEEGSMQSLKHLDIRCCDKLGNIPATLLQQETLEKMVLTGMPHRFTTEVERLKFDHTSLTINDWKFPPLPWEQDNSTSVNHSKT